MPFPNPATQFKPGQSGYKGRHRKKPLTDLAASLLESTALNGKPLPGGLTVADMVVLGWIKKAMQGDPQARRDLLERLEGKLLERTEITTPAAAFPPQTQQAAVMSERAAELQCELDALIIATTAPDPGGLCLPGEPGPVADGPAPGPAEPQADGGAGGPV